MDLYYIRNELMSGKSIYDLNLNVTFYTRVSTSSSEQLSSLRKQIDYFKDFIMKVKNWNYIEGYIDEGLSGVSIDKRDSFNRMIQDGRNKKFDLIITKEVSRFARNTLDSLFYTRELLKYGVGVYFQNDNINTLMPDSELRLTIMASMAQEESRKISDRVKWGHKRSIKSGRVLGNDKIWGYDKKDAKLIINEEEAKMVRLIFDLYCEGYGFRKISDILLEKGYKNNNGNPFNYSTLSGIITNPKYKGYYVGNKSTTIDYLTREREFYDKDEWIIYKDHEKVPPIVSEEIWDRANMLLKERSEKMSSEDKTSYQNKFAYSGKIICKTHNASYWRNIYKYKIAGDKEVWQCKIYRQRGKQACNSPMLYKHELDLIMQSILRDFFSNKHQYVEKLIGMIEKILSENDYDKEIKNLMKEIAVYEKRKDNLLDLKADGLITIEEFKKKYNEYSMEVEKREQLKNKYEELNNALFQKTHELDRIKKQLLKNIDFKDDEPNEELIETFLDRIEVYNDGIDNLINLDVILKTGITIPVHYIVNKDMRLSPSIHMIDNKRIFKFARNTDSWGHKPTEIQYSINVFLNYYKTRQY